MVQWEISDGEVDYDIALERMDNYVQKIISGEADEKIWLLEHPSLYTAGTSANKKDLVEPNRFPVFETKRGGQYTYHGPGQRVVYVMLDLNKRGKDVKKFVENLEAWIIRTLAEFNVVGQSRNGRVGIWVERPDKPKNINGLIEEEKIAAIGIRLRKWITFHGLSVNVDPDLSHFQGIVPCGIKEHGVTSLVDLGLPVSMQDLDVALSKSFSKVF
jgi:lipoyl(octanoyl) transferase